MLGRLAEGRRAAAGDLQPPSPSNDSRRAHTRNAAGGRAVQGSSTKWGPSWSHESIYLGPGWQEPPRGYDGRIRRIKPRRRYAIKHLIAHNAAHSCPPRQRCGYARRSRRARPRTHWPGPARSCTSRRRTSSARSSPHATSSRSARPSRASRACSQTTHTYAGCTSARVSAHLIGQRMSSNLQSVARPHIPPSFPAAHVPAGGPPGPVGDSPREGAQAPADAVERPPVAGRNDAAAFRGLVGLAVSAGRSRECAHHSSDPRGPCRGGDLHCCRQRTRRRAERGGRPRHARAHWLGSQRPAYRYARDSRPPNLSVIQTSHVM